MVAIAVAIPERADVRAQLNNGKPIERWGRKVSGLPRLNRPPGQRDCQVQQQAGSRWGADLHRTEGSDRARPRFHAKPFQKAARDVPDEVTCIEGVRRK